MSEFQAISVKRLLLISFILGFLGIILLGQAISVENGEDTVTSTTTTTTSTTSTTTSTSTTSTTTTSTTTSTTTASTTSTTASTSTASTSTTTQVIDQNSTSEIFLNDTIAYTSTYNTAPDIAAPTSTPQADNYVVESVKVQEDGVEKKPFVRSPGLDRFNNENTPPAISVLIVGLEYLIISGIIFGLLNYWYVALYNNEELRAFVDTSLKGVKFDGSINVIGKRISVKYKEFNFSMKLFGIRKYRVNIDLPRNESVDPREFGLRRLENSAKTICDLELLPLRLIVVKLYLDELALI